eukprot:39398-Alexandrium_andersonii.AAC.1
MFWTEPSERNYLTGVGTFLGTRAWRGTTWGGGMWSASPAPMTACGLRGRWYSASRRRSARRS